MAFYIIIWVLLLLFSCKRKNKGLMWFSVIALSFIAGARALNIGTDTPVYYGIFSLLENGAEIPYVEFGWLMLNKLVIKAGLGYNWVLWIAAFISLACVGWVAVKDSPNPTFSLFVYYGMYAYLNSFNIMRQLLAVSIILVGFHYLYKRKYLGYVISIIVASTFHVSAIVAFLALLMIFIPSRPWIFYLSLMFTFVGGLVLNDDLFVRIAGEYGTRYLSGDSYHGYRENIASVALTALAMNGLIVFLFVNMGRGLRVNFWFKLFWAAILLTNITMRLALGTRVIIYFTIAQVVLYPLLLNGELRNRSLIRCLLILYLLVVFLKILILGNNDETGVVPYESVFSSI